MDVLRTPADRFAGLPDFPYEPTYLEVSQDGVALRMAVIDEGPRDAPVVLCLHGEPSWSFLYRTMIPIFLDAGLRVVCPDLIGFGRSDKPTPRTEYTYARHVEWLRSALFDVMDLEQVTLVCQDWGGLLGLRLVGEHPERFAAVVAANTFLPDGQRPLGDAFDNWCEFSQTVPELPVGLVVNGGCTSDLAPEVIAAYDAPFPDESFKEGARQFPILVPNSPDDPGAVANRLAWEGLAAFDRPFVCAFGDRDPVTRNAEHVLMREIAGAAGQPHVTIEGAGHFIQEDSGPQLASVVVSVVHALGD